MRWKGGECGRSIRSGTAGQCSIGFAFDPGRHGGISHRLNFLPVVPPSHRATGGVPRLEGWVNPGTPGEGEEPWHGESGKGSPP
jgi:hypothetical protein